MNPRFALIALLVMPTLAWAQGGGGAQKASPSTTPAGIDRTKASYAVGYQIGTRVAQGKSTFDIDMLVRALRDAYAGRAPKVPAAQMREQLNLLGQQLHERAEEGFHKLAVANAAESSRFMAQNRSQVGVVTLPSGVQYKVLRKGTGAHPTLKSTVVANYRGALIDGMEFDSSYAHGRPVTFPVDRMLPGWKDVLPRMRVGGKWKVWIPPTQAYGARGQLPRIGPNEVLVFEIELLGVK
ncbi:FKBP-type peptidyl-prolyl cis-trans isomerase [Oleiagrimonas soli]|uniref:Peptidyl-prolyl cis-trans isomerase n=1 Tax=Oleiagrimonas soli TaxID=1543381 RepID=A0A099CW80_9GAMM|nr:FKBP-type peptidyl-prolyl cis-trans isomerase [Oleiagrimonas soli]KGI77916.1 peptidylprolyl isomerase [Oleiagrimonas soli]MBB6183717.1 FKBP-type peptidyl-prolyl cis-trans isomerase FklB [Oleiagrimonas soli]